MLSRPVKEEVYEGERALKHEDIKVARVSGQTLVCLLAVNGKTLNSMGY
jgi:hypothetical protein